MNAQISVVVPSFQRGTNIGRTLTSIFEQTLKPSEVIVVNDGSYEETTRYIETHFPQVRLINIPHSGASAARNVGVESAKHDVVSLIDDDDAFLPNGLALLYKTLTTFPQALAAFGDHMVTNMVTGEQFPNHHYVFPQFRRLLETKPICEKDGCRLYGSEIYLSLLHGNILQAPWMIYRHTYLKIGGFPVGLQAANDWDTYLRLTRSGPIAITESVIGNHFIETDRQHLHRLPNQHQFHIDVMQRHLRLLRMTEIQPRIILRRRIALIYKGLGDEARRVDNDKALHLYRQAFKWWPFDSVVALRCLITLPAERFFGGPRPMKLF
jgi:glycosyltransferase involved in cell wall biosynthesis